jgi:carbohydrate diacid regulator
MNYLNKELAQEIVVRTMEIIDHNINVMNDKGKIIGSGDKDRIEQIHGGAMFVIEKQADFEIGEAEASHLYGAKPGINLPITFKGDIVGVIGITGSPDKVRNYGKLVRMAAEMILQQAVLMDQIQWDERLKEELVNQLLHGKELDSLFFERASRLGINLEAPRVVLIFSTSDRHKILSTLKDRIDKEDLYVMLPDGVVLLKKISVKGLHWEPSKVIKEIEIWITTLKKSSSIACKIALGDYHPDLSGISASYHQAKVTLSVGMKLKPNQEIYMYHDYQLPVFLAQATVNGKDEALTHSYYELLQHDKKGELLETLKIYIEEDGESNVIAKRLFIHRNTLRYRLDRINEITGKDPRKIKDLLDLYLSILISQII